MMCDPCPQTGTMCAAAGGSAVTTCLANGTWDGNGCTCVPAGGSSTCGNNLIDTGEQCDGANLNGMSCQTMMPGSTGTLSCDPTTCMLNATMCIPGTAVGTPGGGMGGG
jgi:hypothetical protein